MKLLYCGTAAYEGIPAPFCSCTACKNARENGGKDIRFRTQMIINDDLVVDFPPDAYLHFIRYGIDYSKIKNLLITHCHSDHLYVEDLGIRRKGAAVLSDNSVLGVYAGEKGVAHIKHWLGDNIEEIAQIRLHELKAWEMFVADGYKITPIPARHDPYSSPFIFIIQKDEKAIFYANDTGPLPEETYEKIARLGIQLDLFSADCTMMENIPSISHLMLSEVVEMERKLRAKGCLKDSCKTVITHFSHNSYVSHARLEEAVKPYGFIVAYDGLILNI